MVEYTARLQELVYPNNQSIQVSSRSELEDIGNELKQLCDKVISQQQIFENNETHGEIFKKLGSKYYYIEEYHKMNWFAAGYRCQELGGHLASVQNEHDFNVLTEQLRKSQKPYWIDVNDLSHEGIFLSHTTGRLASYLNWFPTNNPDNARGNENCVHLWYINPRYGMNDVICTNLYHFICEKEMH